MTDIFYELKNWVDQKRTFALATVIRTWGSAPRPVGSALAIAEDMEMIGSVSGGCVEGAVLKEAAGILKTGQPRRLKFGVTDEDAWAVGLSCGGAIQVFTERFMAFDEDSREVEIWRQLSTAIKENRGCVLVSAMDRDKNAHTLVFPDGTFYGKDESMVETALQAFRERRNQIAEGEEESFFIQVFPRKSQLIIVGAAHITSDLVRLGNLYDFETIVIDPRGIFAARTQFADPPDQLIDDWPAEVLGDFTLDEYSYAVLLSHDPKIDDQALHILLKSNIGYIGALGSSRTQQKRVARLEKAGFTEDEIARIHGPIGVDINAQQPREIALSILGEIIKVKNAYL